MLRAQIVTDAARRARADEPVLVRLGELKVSCGEDVVFVTESLERGFAVAVYDAAAHVGGVMASAHAGEQEESTTSTELPFLDAALALPVLIDSIVRMGGERNRLSFAAAGDTGFLALISPALAEAKGTRPRRRARGRKPSVLVLDLGSGLARVEDAAKC